MGFTHQIHCDFCSSTAPGASREKNKADKTAEHYGWKVLSSELEQEKHQCPDCYKREKRRTEKLNNREKP